MIFLKITIIFLSMLFVGLGKAARDTIAHHFVQSIFYSKFLNYPKLLKWFKSDWREWPLFWGIFRFDAWHFFDALIFVGIFFGIGISDGWGWAFMHLCGSVMLFNAAYRNWFLTKRSKK